MSFVEAIELRPRNDRTWSAAIPEGWDFMGMANGGLVSSVMVTALAETAGRPDPITSTAHFLRPAFPGPVSIRTETIRTGRSLTTARADLSQNDRLIAHVVASLGELDHDPADPVFAVPAPSLPPPEECLGPRQPADGFQSPPIAHRLNLHISPDTAAFARGERGEPEMSGWAFVPFGAPTTMMPVVCDAMPPPYFNTGLYFGPLPTVELTVHTYRKPPSEQVQALFKTDHAGPRYLEEDGWIWDTEGKLLAVSRQIALLPQG